MRILAYLITCWLTILNLCLAQNTNTTATCIPPGGPLISEKPDFAACLQNIYNLTVSQRAESGCFGNSETGVLTYDGCNAICGSQYSLWEWKDTVDRLS